jgi:hypothetical protein
MRGCLLLTIELAWSLQIQGPAEARRKATPAQIVQAFLSACYNNRNEDAWAGREEIGRFGAEPEKLPPGSGACYSIAAERWAIRRTRQRGTTAEVDTDIWIWERQDCDWSERYYPSKRTRLPFTLVRKAGEWRLKDYHPLVPRKRALAVRDSPFYLVIAGSFRTERAADLHARRYSNTLSSESPGSIERSGDFARLERGWYVVVPGGGQVSSRDEGELVLKRLASAGVSAYLRRIH